MTDLILETGKVMLRCGHEVRIHATNLSGDRPVLLSYFLPGKGWLALHNSLNGKHSSDADDHSLDHPFDLVPIPQVKYFNVYTSKNGDVSFGCGFNNIGNAKYHGIQYAETAGPFETYKYLDGEITKVEESSNAD